MPSWQNRVSLDWRPSRLEGSTDRPGGTRSLGRSFTLVPAPASGVVYTGILARLSNMNDTLPSGQTWPPVDGYRYTEKDIRKRTPAFRRSVVRHAGSTSTPGQSCRIISCSYTMQRRRQRWGHAMIKFTGVADSYSALVWIGARMSVSRGVPVLPYALRIERTPIIPENLFRGQGAIPVGR